MPSFIASFMVKLVEVALVSRDTVNVLVAETRATSPMAQPICLGVSNAIVNTNANSLH
jgi:hypothetical protein